MLLAGALRSGRRGVALDHRAGLPAGERHQIRLRAARGEVVVGERVPEGVGVQVGEPGFRGSTPQHLLDAALCHPAVSPEPKVWALGVRVLTPNAEVAIQRLHGAGADSE